MDLEIRPIEPDDKAGLAAALEQSSDVELAVDLAD
jgi:hypothetical protein